MVSRLLKGHAQFLSEHASAAGDLVRQLAGGQQSPDALFVGCSDSRVVPELLTASMPGRLFVVRNVANLIPPLDHADDSVGAALEYAIGVLEVPHLVVCGHYGCGGVRAALDGGLVAANLPSLGYWLDGIRPAVELAVGEGYEERYRDAVEKSVLLSLGNVASYPVAARAIAEGKLELHAWVYDLDSLALAVYLADEARFATAREASARDRRL
ncbi:MAG: carbonic anhydrase [Myxococcales bacterium]|nr:carbonic anhydrase [Myxococcales bacterium]